jgi:predicted dehydrogenase
MRSPRPKIIDLARADATAAAVERAELDAREAQLKTLKVGIIGCGSIAQIMHLPYLHELRDRFEVTALCDLSESLLAVLGQQYGVRHIYTDFRELLNHADVDAVMVLSRHHAPAAIAAVGAGKHVFVEKPMVVNLDEADELIATARSAGVQVMVGYMKRYDPDYLAGLTELAPIRDHVRLIELHDLIGPNAAFVAHHHVHRFDDIPAEVLAYHSEAFDAACSVAIGAASADLRTAYNLLLGLNTHDISILRGAFGSPEEVVSADIWHGGRYITAAMRYSDDCRCIFYTGMHSVVRFDERISCVSPERIVEIAFPSPFLKNTPTLVHVHEQRDGCYSTTCLTPSYEEAFREELIHFHECVVHNRAPRTDAVDARNDHVLLLDIVRAYLAQQRR